MDEHSGGTAPPNERVRLPSRKRSKRISLLTGDVVPILRGTIGGSVDLVCGTCEAVLATQTQPGQLLGVSIQCPACGAVSEATRPKGAPIPSAAIAFPEGDVALVGTREVTDIAYVGQTALRAYRKETGYRPMGTQQVPAEWWPTPTALRQIVAGARGCVGASTFEDLRQRYERGRNTRTPQRKPHRLMELVSSVEEAARAVEGGGNDWKVDMGPVTELASIVGLCRRWRRHPAWPILRQSLATNEFVHTVTLLGAASVLVDYENGVGIHEASRDQHVRTPDAFVQPTVIERVHVEVKTPMALREPLSPISRNEADSILREHLKKVVGGSKGQLSEQQGILVIGGLSLRETDLDMMEKVASELLASKEDRYARFVGVMLMTVGVVRPAGRFQSGIATRVVRHPGYKGRLRLSGSDKLKSPA